MPKTWDFEKFITKASEKRPDYNISRVKPEDIKNSESVIDIDCPKGHELSLTVSQFLVKWVHVKCDKCGKPKRNRKPLKYWNQKRFEDEMVETKPGYTWNREEASKITTRKDYVTVTCPSGHSRSLQVGSFLNKNTKCPGCGSPHIRFNTHKDLIDALEKSHLNQGFSFDAITGDKFKCKDKIPVICNNGHTTYPTIDSFLHKNVGCGECRQQAALTTKNFIIKANSKYAPSLFDYTDTVVMQENKILDK